MTFKTEDIAKVYRDESMPMANPASEPGEPEETAPGLFEVLYIGGTPAKNGKKAFIPGGFNATGGIRKKKIPDWALDNRFYHYVFGEDAMKRARVAYLFWRVGMTVPQIAAETRWKRTYIRNVISKLRRKEK